MWFKYRVIRGDMILKYLICCSTFLLTPACQPPDVPVGGSYTPALKEYSPGDQVRLSCDPGLFMIGQMNRSCKLDGRWTGTTPFCDQPAKLKNPGGEVHWDCLQCTMDNNTGTCARSRWNTGQHFVVYLAEAAIVNMIRIFLPRGIVKYDITVSDRSRRKKCSVLRRYLEENQWVQVLCEKPTYSSCIYIQNVNDAATEMSICEMEAYTKSGVWCSNPPNILVQNGFLRVTRDKATLECTEGFKPGIYDRLICENEDWVGKGILHCEEILCDASVKTVNFGVWKLIGNKLSVGSKKKLRCAEGYRVTGNPDHIECLSNGTWATSSATCEEHSSSSDYHQYKPMIIATSSCVTIIIIASLVLVIILLLRKKTPPVVVVLKKEDVDNAMIYSEAEYAAITYDTIRTLTSISSTYPPLPPTRPPVTLAGEYSKPVDRQHPPRYVASPPYTEPLGKMDATDATDVALDVVKVSSLYGEEPWM